MISRRTYLNVLYEGKDITEYISKGVKSFSYSEAMSDEADSCTITLEDRDELWIGDWFPQKGSTLTISMIKEGDRSERRSLGRFEIDEIENSLKPSEARIKLVSIPNSSEIRSVEKSKAWEKITLSKIAKDISSDAGLTLTFKAQSDPVIERIEQNEESDLNFLKKLCHDKGLSLKVSDRELIIFDEVEYEQSAPVVKIIKGSSWIKDFRLSSTIHEIYDACHVKYKHSKKDEKIESTFRDSSKSGGMVLEVNQKVENQAEADQLAKKKLREKNKEEVKASFTMIGDFKLFSGSTVELEGFHVYDGKYIITKSTHEIGSGYTTKIELQKCLGGY